MMLHHKFRHPILWLVRASLILHIRGILVRMMITKSRLSAIRSLPERLATRLNPVSEDEGALAFWDYDVFIT